MLQLYSPGHEQNAFHRTIFVFVCSSKNFCPAPPVVLRQQLPVKNKFYPEEAPDYENRAEIEKVEQKFAAPKMCKYCGFIGKNRCAKCKCVFYCCKEHQVADWRAGHKEQGS